MSTPMTQSMNEIIRNRGRSASTPTLKSVIKDLKAVVGTLDQQQLDDLRTTIADILDGADAQLSGGGR